MIGYYRDNVVCLSVCLLPVRPIAMLCSVALKVGVWVSYRLQPCSYVGRALPIHFLRQFCCRMYSLATKYIDDRTAKKLTGINSRLLASKVDLLAIYRYFQLLVVVENHYGLVC